MRGALVTAVFSAAVFIARDGAAAPPTEAEPHAETNAYASWFGGDRYPAQYGRAAAEVVGLVAAGLAYYWADPLANKEDWDNPSVKDRIDGRSLRFDTNLNTTNHLLHPIAGSLVYTAGRVNGLPVLPSFAMGVAQSFLWEMAFEWREKASINDLVYTPMGGLVLGEALYELGEYVNSAPRAGLAQEIAAWTLGFPRRIHRAFDGDEHPPVALPPDRLGFSSAFGHGFMLRYAPSILTNERDDRAVMHSALLDAEVAAMPGFLAPSAFSQFFANGNFTETHLRLGWSNTGFVESDLQARATLFGHYEQDFEDEGNGHASMIGAGSGLRFQRSQWLGRNDQLSMVHVFGPHGEVWIREGALLARFGAEAYFDFASIASLAYPEAVLRFGDGGWKSVLRRQGYQYSLGQSAKVRGEIAIGPAFVGGSIALGRYGSIEGADRYQERITRDVHGTESLVEPEAHAGIRVGIVRIGVAARERWRESTLANVVARRLDRDASLDVGLAF